MFRVKQTIFELLYAQKCQKRFKKPIKSQLNTKFLACDYVLQFKPLQHNNIYQIVLCAMFHAKQTKFELLCARKCQKSLKTHKTTT